MHRLLRRLAPGLLALACSLPFSAHAIDFTDMWWNPNESGWGVNLVENDTIIYATFFVYGPNNQPTWYSAVLQFEPANSRFVGTMYSVTGPWFGTVPFNPATVGVTEVGSATFTPTAPDTGVITYNVGATTVTKNIQRETLRTIALGGSYFGGVVTNLSNCQNPALNGTTNRYATLAATHLSNNQFALDIGFGGGPTCTLAGALTQVGKLYRVPSATYSCGGAAVMAELTTTSFGLQGQWAANVNVGGSACVESGRFTGVLM